MNTGFLDGSANAAPTRRVALHTRNSLRLHDCTSSSPESWWPVVVMTPGTTSPWWFKPSLSMPGPQRPRSV